MSYSRAKRSHLDEDLSELAGREVVQEGVEHGTKVEEGVGHRVQHHIVAEVGHGPAGLGHGGSHQATHLVGQPAHGRGSEREREGRKEKK
uniref:Uncharacterized protein n=1 Tax=Oncorhynchus tshawytscha TaxID=74940 RepID=A0A8C8BPV0_ONCTS